MSCPICATLAPSRFGESPYWMCPSCDCWFQDPAPPKVYHATHEGDPAAMSNHDKAVNDSLAGWLFDKVMNGKPGPTLDIGAAYPYLASRLQARGCTALAIDGDPSIISYGIELGVFSVQTEFESYPFTGDRYNLITLIHSFEHLYRPIEALRKLRRLVADDGRIFIRSPDHSVPGFERDLTPGHYSIHVFFHTLSSILECCVQTETFAVESYAQLKPGQMDLVLVPL